MTSAVLSEAGRPWALETVLLGGLIAGVLDGLDAVIYYRWALGVTPTLLFQNIASGILGGSAFRGGLYTTGLGIALHFTIALGAAAVFYAASLLTGVRNLGLLVHALPGGTRCRRCKSERFP